ncbi:VOC family protein [Microbacterium sp.]|uniref:VOC family protein n=1 Tax=Microbacterium sp. TaxID=51671 RepID=UPI0025DB3F05|nr:VOC family protein [Microbacterium sp.]
MSEQSSATELHFCIVTDDISRTTEWLTSLLGAPLPAIEDGPRPNLHQEYRGDVVDDEFRQVYFIWRGVGIELIQPGPRPSSWRSHLERFGTGIHHIGVRGGDTPETGEELTRMGHAIVHQGGSDAGSFAYFDTTSELGVLLELVTDVSRR